jgi:acetyl esterase/lipase
MRIVNLALGLALLVSSCSKDVDNTGEKQALPAESRVDVSYGNDPEQKMDVYLPPNRDENTRMLIIIHGGGWSGGDKSDFDTYISEFQNRLPGYAFANLNYRLVKTTGNYFPTQENDINSAVMFLKDNAAAYNVSTNFVYLGISAGAHLALLQGYKHTDAIQPRGIVSFFGPVDLQKLYTDADSSIPYVLRTVMNATLEGNPDIFYQSSPINYVVEGSAPTLMLHGDADQIVPLEQPYMLRDKLDQLGVRNKLVVYPGQGHGWIGDDLLDSFEQVVSFVKSLEN